VITRLRKALIGMTDDDHSICRIAAEHGIFCGGFQRLSDAELRKRYHWLSRKDPSAPRPQLEELANSWELARQIVREKDLACDVQTIEHDTCLGWDEFSNEELARFHSEILGEEILVT